MNLKKIFLRFTQPNEIPSRTYTYTYLYSCIAKNPRYIEGENCEIKSVNDVPLHLEFGLKFRKIWVLRKNHTRINKVFHEKQDKIQSALLDGG